MQPPDEQLATRRVAFAPIKRTLQASCQSSSGRRVFVATMSRSVLVIDALNCLNYFCGGAQPLGLPKYAMKKRDPWQVVGIMGQQIRKFLEAADASELCCKFVVDRGWSSSEVGAKWKSRRTKEVRDMPTYTCLHAPRCLA